MLWDTASRIGHQLRVCDWRLREISEAYSTQLLARLKRKDFKIGTRFEDGFTWLTYLSLQSFLVDACILRDYLSEFAAEYIYKPMIDLGNQRITAMGALKKKVLNKISDPGHPNQRTGRSSRQQWLANTSGKLPRPGSPFSTSSPGEGETVLLVRSVEHR